MFDDAGRLGDHLAVVDERRKFGDGPKPLELGVIGLVVRDLPVFERRAVGPDWDQHLPAVAAERVDEEFEAHQAPSAILLRSSISAWLGSFVAKVLVSTSQFGW